MTDKPVAADVRHARWEHAWRLAMTDKLTLREIGKRLNVSRERARQLLGRYIRQSIEERGARHD